MNATRKWPLGENDSGQVSQGRRCCAVEPYCPYHALDICREPAEIVHRLVHDVNGSFELAEKQVCGVELVSNL